MGLVSRSGQKCNKSSNCLKNTENNNNNTERSHLKTFWELYIDVSALKKLNILTGSYTLSYKDIYTATLYIILLPHQRAEAQDVCQKGARVADFKSAILA